MKERKWWTMDGKSKGQGVAKKGLREEHRGSSSGCTILREESRLVVCFQSGGILRLLRQPKTISATCSSCAVCFLSRRDTSTG